MVKGNISVNTYVNIDDDMYKLSEVIMDKKLKEQLTNSVKENNDYLEGSISLKINGTEVLEKGDIEDLEELWEYIYVFLRDSYIEKKENKPPLIMETGKIFYITKKTEKEANIKVVGQGKKYDKNCDINTLSFALLEEMKNFYSLLEENFPNRHDYGSIKSDINKIMQKLDLEKRYEVNMISII